MQLQVQLQGRLPTCITYHAFSGGAHKTWPLGLTFVAILGELSESEVRPVGFVLLLAAVHPTGHLRSVGLRQAKALWTHRNGMALAVMSCCRPSILGR